MANGGPTKAYLDADARHDPPVKTRSFEGSIQAFIEEVAPSAHWDLCQATWSLQNLSPAERADAYLLIGYT